MKRTLFQLLFLLTGLPAFSQLQNADFEQWYTENNVQKLDGWEHLVKTDWYNNDLFGTWQVGASQHGNYALELSRWYYYTWDVVRQRVPVSTPPTVLSGYYSLTKNEISGAASIDTALVQVVMTKWNAALQIRDTVGYGRKELSTAVSFTPFNCYIQYSSAQQPDSMLVHIQPSKFAGQVTNCLDSGYCSWLKVDNLSLQEITGVDNLAELNAKLFPNPVSDQLHIELASASPIKLSIYDMTGRLVKEDVLDKNSSTIDMSNLYNGIYLVHLQDDNAATSVRRVAKNR